MKTFIIITLIFICFSQNANVTRELEIGVIQFEEAKGSQIYNQLVRFDTPFRKIPQVGLALVEHTSTTALFAKVKNITQEDFIIQFFSAVTLNATYRYLAITNDDVYINCSNFKATQQAIFRYPQFQQKVEAIGFLVGYHHNGFVNISLNQNNNIVKLIINTNDVQQTAIGVCLIVGSNLKFDDETETQKFSGRISSQGQIRSLSFITSIFKILFIEDQQIREQTSQKIEETLTDMKTLFDQESYQQVEELQKSSKQLESVNQLDDQEIQQFEEQQEEINDNEYLSNDNSSEEEEEDDYFWNSKNKQQKQSSVDFELQLTLLQDVLKKKPQIQQQTIKEIIKQVPNNQNQQQQEIQKKQKKTVQANINNKLEIEQNTQQNEKIINKETKFLNNEEIDMQLQQKESHVRSLKKALNLVGTVKEKELEIIYPQINNQNVLQELKEVKIDNNIQEDPQLSKCIGYQSPLIDDIPKIEEIIQVKQKDKKITQKLDSYMQSFSEDTYIQKIKKTKEEDQLKNIQSTENQIKQNEQVQLIQLKGQSHSTKVVYEASEDSLRKFEEDFERRKQEKMMEIKQQLIPENKPTKIKFLSLAQEDQQLKSYKDFFYN